MWVIYISLLMSAPSISLAWFLRTLGSHSFWVMKVPEGLRIVFGWVRWCWHGRRGEVMQGRAGQGREVDEGT